MRPANWPLRFVVFQVVELRQVGSRHLRQRLIGHDLEDAAQVLRLQPGLRGESAGLGALEKAGIERLHDFDRGVANVVEDFAEIGDDIGGAAAGGDDVVNAREVGRMLAQQLGRVVRQLDRVEGGSAHLGRRGRVRARAVEPELDRDPGLARPLRRPSSGSMGASASTASQSSKRWARTMKALALPPSSAGQP